MLLVELLFGLLILILGAEYLISGAIILGRKFNLSEVFIGIIIIGFGTSLCELFVSIDAVLSNASELSLGNIVGSNIANILLVIGSAALIKSFRIPKLPNLDLLTHIFATLLFTFVCFFSYINIYWGILFVLCFIVYFFKIIDNSKNLLKSNDNNQKDLNIIEKSVWKSPFIFGPLIIFSSIFLIFSGADLTVDSAIEISKILGISESIIGLSLIAIGTSLPEIASGIVAVRKGKFLMVVGNVVGSNLYNILLIIGASTFFNKYDYSLENISNDLIFLNCCLIFFTFLTIKKVVISKIMSIVMLLMYLGYLGYIFSKTI